MYQRANGGESAKRRVSLREPLDVALETLWAHKLRSFLMLLGIILSVATLITVVALIEGANQYIASRVANLGANVFVVERFGLITELEDFVKATRRNRMITLGRLPGPAGGSEAAQGSRRRDAYQGQSSSR